MSAGRRRVSDAQQADRPAADHEHGVAGPERGAPQRSDADRQRLDQRGGGVADGVGHLVESAARNGRAVGEHARAVEPEQGAPLAEVLLAAQARAALAAHDEREDGVAPAQALDRADHLVP